MSFDTKRWSYLSSNIIGVDMSVFTVKDLWGKHRLISAINSITQSTHISIALGVRALLLRRTSHNKTVSKNRSKIATSFAIRWFSCGHGHPEQKKKICSQCRVSQMMLADCVNNLSPGTSLRISAMGSP